MGIFIQPSRCVGKVGDDITESPNHVAEEKMDGSRYVLYIGYDPFERREGNTLLSRRKSTVDGKNVDRTGNVPHITQVNYEDLEGTVIDGEMFIKDFPTTSSIMGSGNAVAVQKQKEKGFIEYHVFDVPVFRGKDIRGLPLEKRRKVLEAVVEKMENEFIKVLPQYPSSEIDKKFIQIVSAGGEGLIIKDLRTGYGVAWTKKKKVSDVSCWISGFKPGKGKYAGMVGAIELSVFDDTGTPLAIGWASGFNDTLREDMTEEPEKFVGKVVDVYAHELSKKNRLRHPTFFRFRDNMEMKDCTLQKVKDDLKNKIKSNRWRAK